MQVLVRWRNNLIPRTTNFQSLTGTALFHSTGSSFDKWKTKFDFEDVPGDRQPPSKDYIRYAVRQKRAATKNAVKDVLFFNGGCSRVEDSFSKIEAEDADRLNKKSRIKPARQAKKAHHKKIKSKHRREECFEDFDEKTERRSKHRREEFFEDFDEQTERRFQGKFGKRNFTWTFRPWEKGFDWGETSDWGYFRFKESGPKNRRESDDEPFILGTSADRRILGLPLAGPLRIEDVKAAFRISALKWHPDKHQGSSRADAEEKFKHCANAYKSLCSALSTT